MRSRSVSRLAAVAGAAALIAMGGLTAACGGKEEEKPSTTTTTTTTTTTPPPVAPTQNEINPGGPNLFTPTPVQPAPTVSTHKRSSHD